MLHRSVLFPVALIALVGLTACGSEEPGDVNVGCRLNSDCSVGQVCTDGVCGEAPPCEGEDCLCVSDDDCDDGALCNFQTGECFTPACTSDQGCGLGEVCLAGRCLTDVDADRDRDGVPDTEDSCPNDQNADQEDLDGDGDGDVCDDDIDGDGINNDVPDNCPSDSNPEQEDEDGNGIGDACERDQDFDGVRDDLDNCSAIANPDQNDLNTDGTGDVCDSDDDGDGTDDGEDNCPRASNPDQEDDDNNGVGNVCEGDRDSDGVRDDLDNCPTIANPGQDDLDTDQEGDVCDFDVDGDEVNNGTDNCPHTTNPLQEDRDNNGVGDACEGDADFDGTTDDLDNCPLIANPSQDDLDSDELGDVCDTDDDGDSIDDEQDNCSRRPNPGQEDDDNNGIGDVCEGDRDTDGVPDHRDNCLTEPNPDQNDLDFDSLGDECDPDDDGDRVLDERDNCPVNFNPDQFDADEDNQGNACDDDWRGTTVRGRLSTDDILNPPFAQAQVRLSGVETPQRPDDEGQFVFENALQTPGTFAIEISWPTFRDKTITFASNPGLEEVNLDDIDMQHESEVDPVRLEGVVKLGDRPSDSPVHGGINVTVRTTDQRLFATLSTNEDGQFTVPAARTGYLLTLSKEGYDPLTAISADWDENQENFVIHEGQAIRLISRSTASLTGSLVSDGLEIQDWTQQVRYIRLFGNRLVVPGVVDNTGSFNLLESVAPGTYTLEVSVRGHLLHVSEVVLDDGVNELPPITLTPESQDDQQAVNLAGVARLEGQSEGTHANIIVRAIIGNQAVDNAVTDPSGNFSIRTSRLDHALEISHPGYLTRTVQVAWDEADDRFEINDVGLDEDGAQIALSANLSASVEGRLTSPLQGVEWTTDARLTLIGPSRRLVPVNNAGEFEADNLPPGFYVLNIDVTGHAPIAREITLDGDGTDVGSIVLEPLVVFLNAMVNLQGGLTPDNILVRARLDGRVVTSATTEEQGLFTLSLSPRTHNLTFTRIGFFEQEITAVWNQDHFETNGLAIGSDTVLATLLRQPQSDLDADGVIDVLDNCPLLPNPLQDNVDGDDQGDACDRDIDADGIVNGLDNCPFVPNPMQEDTGGKGLGTVCSSGTAEEPFGLGRGVLNQRLDSRGRADVLAGSCGGAGAPEIVYILAMEQGQELSVRVKAEHAVAIYAENLDSSTEVACSPQKLLNYTAAEAGKYKLVIDGLVGEFSSGPMVISASNQTPWALSPAETYPTGSTPRAVEAADFNNDGRPDLVTANSSGTVSVLLGQPNGEFGGSSHTTVGAGTFDVEIGDFNGDGNADLVTANDGERSLTVLLGQGNGSFALHSTLDLEGAPRVVAVKDLNGDGALDLVTVYRAIENKAVVFIGRGDGSFSDGVGFNLSANPSVEGNPIAVEDIDGDGHLDLLVAIHNASDLDLLLGRGDGSFQNRIGLSLRDTIEEAQAADLNDDGFMDIIAKYRGEAGVVVTLGQGNLSFSEPASFSFGQPAGFVTVRDMDRDGVLDISALSNDRIIVLRGIGEGSFSEPHSFDGVVGSTAIGLADLDGDGVSDVLTVLGNTDSIGVVRGTGTQTSPLSFDLGGRTNSFAAGDFNQDGLVDLVAGLSQQGDGLAFLMGKQHNNFSLPTLISVDHPIGYVVAADPNGDNNLDALLLGNNTLTTLPGDGRGGFGASLEQATSSDTSFIAGDVDGDGHIDLAVVDFQEIAFYRGVGDGTYSSLVRLPMPSNPRETPVNIALGDMDSDGRPDLVATLSTNTFPHHKVRVWLNEGDFRFQEGYLSNMSPQGTDALELADIDGDGDIDILTSHAEGFNPRLYGFRNQGDAQFSPSLQLPMSQGGARHIVAKDVNSDGLLDIVGISFNRASLFLAIAAGRFAPERSFPLSNGQSDLAVEDLDGNGLLEILVANDDEELVRVLGDVDPLVFLLPGSRLTDSTLPDCPPTEINGDLDRASFEVRPAEPCRISRVELDVTYDEISPPKAIRFGSIGGVSVPLVSKGLGVPASGRWRPEKVSNLARFEGSPATGRWRLKGIQGLSQAVMRINHLPTDPFDPELPNPPCSNQEDQADEPDLSCILGNSLSDLALTDEDDVDLFILEGLLEGAFIEGQIINVTASINGGGPIEVSIVPLGAERPLFSRQFTDNGTFSFEVPPSYHLRYFSLLVRHIPGSDLPVVYDLEVEDGGF